MLPVGIPSVDPNLENDPNIVSNRLKSLIVSNQIISVVLDCDAEVISR